MTANGREDTAAKMTLEATNIYAENTNMEAGIAKAVKVLLELSNKIPPTKQKEEEGKAAKQKEREEEVEETAAEKPANERNESSPAFLKIKIIKYIKQSKRAALHERIGCRRYHYNDIKTQKNKRLSILHPDKVNNKYDFLPPDLKKL